MTTNDLQDIVTTREAAKMLGVSLRTVQLWVESGVLNAWKTPGGHRKVTIASINKIIENRKNSIRTDEDSSAPGKNTFSILIVEDDEALRNLFKIYFSNWKLQVNVSFAANGFEGLIDLGKRTPDLLITDLMMPNIDGFELIRHLKKTKEYANLDIIVFTGLSNDEIAKRGGLPKDIRLFFKPVSFDIIESAVASSIAKKSNS